MNKKVLVAPLNWGLGHATRCIPIVNALLSEGFSPVIASDGVALSLLKKEFPTLEMKELPSYDVTYSKKANHFKLKMLLNTPKIARAIKEEKKATKEIISSGDFCGIISDNRLGVRHKSLPSVFITHQLTVLSGKTTAISTKIHNKYIKKFDSCWVPDMAGSPNLSGELGHPKKSYIPITYLGPLSRFTHENLPKKYDIMILLSGPEPQRSLLEEKLIKEFKQSDKKIVFVKGLIEEEHRSYTENNITVHNYLTGNTLQDAINNSKLIISRSGYTTIMDLAKLKKKAFFIPTPGQFEQEYLAKILCENKIVPSCSQDEFTLQKLQDINHYKGLRCFSTDINYRELFNPFQRK
ncbi:glycosyltransferase [Aquimarina hainanensis]|uniref:Glycosyltransferase n=1 Tax=Aquimarina hainanensis TaxID=1578017 RepID=A0ABW5N5R1_9FLAO|nr:glycosyltransferase [Aquimarina sp. TRL1]QKX04408.1 glycosyltransferase [Aquimarina sp. TRL1]